ncbi:helix-turn-helix transcriptional regulator [Amycolatopsis thermophila]|uniref:DNA-binding CsgD family transcriptional regulator n=1 Tax=Amycolatopsis thermophila TaxID=206084 RepID=A0ABU0EYF9_9PSEU|nr:LuxR C-terminal-related transcriptional regulator [Amycolatopsis thermophila]MDQ0380357.1 DNA-binding CsgD family transcriptional regulator [Amycolatopsis thermophila]
MTAKVLTGLLSEAGAEAYDRLHTAGQLTLGTGPGEFDLDSEVGRELLDAGLVTLAGAGGQPRFVRVVHPVIALRRLLDRQHRQLSALQGRLAESWERFADLVAPTTGLAQGALDGEDVQAVRDPAEMARLAAGLYRSPRRLLRATFNARSGHNPTTEGLLLPPPDAIAAGVEFRMLYDAEHASDEWGSHSIEQSVLAGEQARIRRSVPVKMMHVDDSVALVTIDRTGADGALHVRSPALLALLAEWFDALWDAPGTTTIGESAPAELTPARHKILRLLAAGLTDEAIARQTGTAVRTVRRHVGAILELLGVESRFAAGVAAVRRGWL